MFGNALKPQRNKCGVNFSCCKAGLTYYLLNMDRFAVETVKYLFFNLGKIQLCYVKQRHFGSLSRLFCRFLYMLRKVFLQIFERFNYIFDRLDKFSTLFYKAMRPF